MDLEHPCEGYVELILPEGYSWKNESSRQDLPVWRIYKEGELDTPILTVRGAWKGTYDNKLSLYLNPNVFTELEGE